MVDADGVTVEVKEQNNFENVRTKETRDGIP